MDDLRIRAPIRNIYFVYQGKRSFFEADLEILNQIAEVEALDNFPPSVKNITHVIREIYRSDLVYIWFMGRHAVLPLLIAKLFGKKVILVAGGWDAANCPEIGYGLMCERWYRPLVLWLFKLPDKVLAISESNRKEIVENAQVPLDRVKLVYLGFKAFKGGTEGPKAPLIVTVGEITQSNLKRKGLEIFVRTAALMPETPFMVIGRWAQDGAIDFLKSIASPNVTFTGFISDEEKEKQLARASVYAQLSYHEAFGCAVAEAMLHACVPVVSDRYALPEVVGDAGYIVPYRNLQETVQAIRKALENRTAGPRARKRILEKFSFRDRAQKIQEVIKSF